MSLWQRIDQNFEEVTCATLLSIIIVLLGIQVFLRFLFNSGIEWAEEIIRYCFVWMNYVGVALGAKKLGHIRITAFFSSFSQGGQKVILAVADVLWVIFNIMIVYISWEMIIIMLRFKTMSPILQINIAWVYLIIPLGFALTTIRILQVNCRNFCKSRTESTKLSGEE